MGIRPYVVSIRPVSGGDIINTSITYRAGDTVHIEITFSAPVVVFPAPNTGLLPTLLLETGLVRQLQDDFPHLNMNINHATTLFDY